MIFTTTYESILGNILLASDGSNLVGLWIEHQNYYLAGFQEELKSNDNLEIFKQTKHWLDNYFRGEKVSAHELSLKPIGNEFRQNVWKFLCEIPYGETTTYGEIAKKLAKLEGKNSMSAQAIGGAIGHNPISIIIPCHRVIAKNGCLTGYAGGIDKKIKLLELEKAQIKKKQ